MYLNDIYLMNKLKKREEKKMKELNNIFDQNTQINHELPVGGLENFTKLAGEVDFDTFVSGHRNDTNINGIISNLNMVKWFFDHVEINMNYAAGRKPKAMKTIYLYIDFYDPEGSYKGWKGTSDFVKSPINCKGTSNHRIVWFGSSIAAETFVAAAVLWSLAKNGMGLKHTYEGMCADVLDASGSKKSRQRYGLKYNISPSNIELVSRTENSSRSSHRQHSLAALKKQKDYYIEQYKHIQSTASSQDDYAILNAVFKKLESIEDEIYAIYDEDK